MALSGAAPRLVAEPLRRAYAVAVDRGIAPFRAAVEELARRARVDLSDQQARPRDGAEQLGLTEREAEVLALLAEGRTNRQIGQVLFIIEKTVSAHVSWILTKLGVSNRGEAAPAAHRVGLVRPGLSGEDGRAARHELKGPDFGVAVGAQQRSVKHPVVAL